MKDKIVLTEETLRKIFAECFPERINIFTMSDTICNTIITFCRKSWQRAPYIYILLQNHGLCGTLDSHEESDLLSEINVKKSLDNILSHYNNIIRLNLVGEKPETQICVNEHFITFKNYFFIKDKETINTLRSFLVKKEIKKEEARFRWCYWRNGQVISKTYTFNNKNAFDLSNYNLDFNEIDEQIQNHLKEDESALIMLHGEPGTGKSTYIKHLMQTMTSQNFYWIDSSMFAHITESPFIDFLTDLDSNSIFILEDCEKILVSRDASANPLIQTLLSLTDGILGNALNIKFICTFNSNISKIDKALLRKGRLKLKYVFGKLSKDRVEAIFEKLNIDKSLAKPMPLCDVYNLTINNSAEEKAINKIGF